MKKITVKSINILLNERDLLLKMNKKDILLKKSNRADEIQKQISDSIRQNFDKYPVDFIMETWTRFGAAPSLIYDDNGLFAVTEEAYQPVVTGKQKINGAITVFVTKKQWKKTIREALKQYIGA
jgi:hypothetical protein